MSDQTCVVSAIQMASGPNVDANLLKAEKLIETAVDDGAQLIVLPENFACMGLSPNDHVAIKENIGDGTIQAFLAREAERHNIWLVGGTVPISTERSDKYRSSALVYNDKGEMVHRYDKTHLFDVKVVDSDEEYTESATIEPGGDSGVVETPFGKLGVAICYDLRFPELFRIMLEQGMEILALPSAFTAITGNAHWEILVRARAIENLSYVIAADQGGFHINGRETYGHSMVIDPWGKVLNELSSGAGAVTVKLDKTSLKKVREQFPVLTHRRIHCRCD